MSEVCQSLINDYLAGALQISDLEEGLASIFDAMPGGHVEAQNYLQSLYTDDKIDSAELGVEIFKHFSFDGVKQN